MTDTIQIAGSGLGNQVAGPLGRTFGWLAMGVSLVLLCYVTFPVVFLCIGRGLLKDRVKLAAGGGLFLVGTLLMFLTLFNTLD